MKMLMRRFFGMIIILRALLPVILIVAVVLIAGQVTKEVKEVMAPPVEQIKGKVDNIKNNIDETKAAVNSVNDKIDDMAETASTISEALTVGFNFELPTAINPFTLAESLANLFGQTITPTLKKAEKVLEDTFDILGLQQIKGLFSDIAEIMQDIAEIAGISAVADDVNAIVTQTQIIIKQLLAIVRRWGPVVILLVVFTGIILLFSYLEYLYRNLTRGWAMLRGKPDPYG